MSGGERQMLAVGRALMSDPKLLMLDEPSLGLAPAVVESMYETFGRLHREGLTILLAEQSIELALEVSDFATVLAGRQKRAVGHRGGAGAGSAGAEGVFGDGLSVSRLARSSQDGFRLRSPIYLILSYAAAKSASGIGMLMVSLARF